MIYFIDIQKVYARIKTLKESRHDCAMPSRILTNPNNPDDLLGGDWWEDENPEDARELKFLEDILNAL